MNAVNLIPDDRRKRSAGISLSPVTLGVIGALVVVLAAAVLYVFAVNDVRARKSELARVTANAASWQAAANSYASYVTAAQQQKQQLADIRQLATGRFPWTMLLSQIGGLMPADAALSSLQATSPTSGAAASTSSTAAAAPSTPGSQAVQITGCAASQSAVAATMVALGRVHGVGSVTLASTSDSAAAGSSSSSSSSGGGSSSGSGGCSFPVSFSMSLILAPSASSGSTAGSTTPASSSTAVAATPSATTATTPSTGSAQ